MYKVILFDLDGTLTESGEGITKSVQYALEKLGISAPDLEALKVFIGPPLLEQFMNYAHLDEETGRKAVEYYRERYSVTGLFENSPYEGVREMLEVLKKQGYTLAVASSKPEKFVLQILEHFDLKDYFEEIVGSEMSGKRTSKAAVIEEALARLGISDKREEVIMVGDREHDILGAAKCGIECIAVSYGYGSYEELVNANPLKIAKTPKEVSYFFA